jgi:uncharacterized protein
VILFGGEPLLEKELIGRALADFNAIAVAHGASFAVRITTNGELLDEEACEILRAYQWEKLQVTLDGPRELHDARRFGKKHRPTFDTIISNLERIAENSELSDIDLRITIDSENAESLSSLLDYLAALRWKDRLRLNLGFTTPSLNSDLIRSDQDYIADVAVSFWARAKAQGFRIPDEYVVGPWCVAIAKHSAVIQPNGALQKCFCTVGRHDYDFATVAEVPGPYAKDARFEGFERTDRCIEERCPYLPMCGGGCIHDALVSYGPGGFGRRFCQKKQISKINEGLIRLNYG